MRPLAVVAESFAVIAGDDDHRLVCQTAIVQPGEHARDLRIGVRDFAVVRALRTCAEFGRRVVGGVRIVEMDPYEERSSLLVAGCRGLLEPGEGGVDHGGCGPFRFETLGRPRIARDAIVVGIEALGEAVAAIEHERADECSGAVSRCFQ